MKTKHLLLLLTPFVLAGCSAYGGKDTFDCPNTAVGAACMSAKQIYSQTHTTDRVQPSFKDGKSLDKSDTSGKKGDVQGEAGVASNGLNTYKPPLPEIDTPLPIRTPAKVLRIRVFPWEDNSKDLNTGGYVYTEVEGRTWNIGEEQISRVQTNVVSPLAPVGKSLIPISNNSPLDQKLSR